MTFVVNDRTRSLLKNALALYLDGGMLALADECGFDGSKTPTSSDGLICAQLGLNDARIWHVLLNAHKDPMGKRWEVPGLSIGWYAVGCMPKGVAWANEAKGYVAN